MLYLGALDMHDFITWNVKLNNYSNLFNESLNENCGIKSFCFIYSYFIYTWNVFDDILYFVSSIHPHSHHFVHKIKTYLFF
jgi:hypothetical protein